MACTTGVKPTGRGFRDNVHFREATPEMAAALLMFLLLAEKKHGEWWGRTLTRKPLGRALTEPVQRLAFFAMHGTSSGVDLLRPEASKRRSLTTLRCGLRRGRTGGTRQQAQGVKQASRQARRGADSPPRPAARAEPMLLGESAHPKSFEQSPEVQVQTSLAELRSSCHSLRAASSCRARRRRDRGREGGQVRS